MSKKTEAIKLRSKGFTYLEISKKLGGIPKSTLSSWLSNIPLSTKAKKKLSIKRAKNHVPHLGGQAVRLKAIKTRNKLIASAREAFDDVDLTYEAGVLAGTALYWAEGAKHVNNFRFSNSDPDMVWLMRQWFRHVISVDLEDLFCSIHVYTNNGLSYEEIEKWWSRRLKIPRRNFIKPQINKRPKSSKKKRPNRLFYGVLTLGVRKSQKHKAKYYALLEKLGGSSNDFIRGG